MPRITYLLSGVMPMILGFMHWFSATYGMRRDKDADRISFWPYTLAAFAFMMVFLAAGSHTAKQAVRRADDPCHSPSSPNQHLSGLEQDTNS